MRYPMYRPKERQWDKDHITALNNGKQPEVISVTYRNYETQKLEFTLTSLTEAQLVFDGVKALDSNFQVINQKSTLINQIFYLFDLAGRILISNVYPKINFVQEMKFFNDTSITGLENENWKEVLNQILYQNGEQIVNLPIRNFSDIINIWVRIWYPQQILSNSICRLQVHEIDDNDTQQLKSELLNQANAQLIYYILYNISGYCFLDNHSFFLKPYYELTKLFQQTTQTKFNLKYQNIQIVQSHSNWTQQSLQYVIQDRINKIKRVSLHGKLQISKEFSKNAYKFRFYIRLIQMDLLISLVLIKITCFDRKGFIIIQLRKLLMLYVIPLNRFKNFAVLFYQICQQINQIRYLQRT